MSDFCLIHRLQQQLFDEEMTTGLVAKYLSGKKNEQIVKLQTDSQRVRFISALALEHRQKMDRACEETGISLVGNDNMNAQVFEHLCQTYIRPIWASYL